MTRGVEKSPSRNCPFLLFLSCSPPPPLPLPVLSPQMSVCIVARDELQFQRIALIFQYTAKIEVERSSIPRIVPSTKFHQVLSIVCPNARCFYYMTVTIDSANGKCTHGSRSSRMCTHHPVLQYIESLISAGGVVADSRKQLPRLEERKYHI